jgi:hypothetical protein
LVTLSNATPSGLAAGSGASVKTFSVTLPPLPCMPEPPAAAATVATVADSVRASSAASVCLRTSINRPPEIGFFL